MKRRCIIRSLCVFVSLIMLTGMTLAYSTNSCSSPDQVILSLYDMNNSHAANASEQNAGYKICYDQIFGSAYTGTDPHACNGNNKVISLSSAKNAHAGNSYDYDLCYGDLTCNLRPGSNPCASGEEPVISLFRETNSHVAYGENPDYNHKVCCRASDDIIIDDGNETHYVNFTIMGIEDGKAYFVGVPINISYRIGTQIQNRNLTLSWNVINASNGNVEISTTNSSFMADFTPGQKIVKVTGINYYGARVNIEINILIVPGNSDDKMLAFISSPKHRQLIPLGNAAESTNNGIKIVNYNGEGSYVLESNYDVAVCTGEVTCLAGRCPDLITNVKVDCPNKSVGNAEKPYTGLNFKWYEYGLEDESIKQGNAVTSGDINYPNTKFSKKPHDKEIALTLEYNTFIQQVRRNFTLGQCVYGSRGYIQDIISGGEYLTATVDPAKYGRAGDDPVNFLASSCKGPDGDSGTIDDCCPSGYKCTQNQGCMRFAGYNLGCGAKTNTTKETCESTPWNEVKDLSGSDNRECGAVRKECSWNQINKICSDKNDYINIDTGDVRVSKIVTYQNLTPCDPATGYWQVKVTTVCQQNQGQESCIPNDATCNGEPLIQTAACGNPLFKVPLFGFWQFMTTIIGITLIYLLIGIFLKRK